MQSRVDILCCVINSNNSSDTSTVKFLGNEHNVYRNWNGKKGHVFKTDNNYCIFISINRESHCD